MEIRNRSELANILGMAFKSYANNLENHYQLDPYLPYLEGIKAVSVTVKLFNGGISVEKGPDTDVYKAEISVLESRVKDREKEIKSLNLLLEEQKPPEPILRDTFSSADGDVLEQLELLSLIHI